MSRKISTIFWDVDGTLLDFLAAEKAAIKAMFIDYGFGECTDAMIARYSQINRSYWERLERGEITKAEVLLGRFRDFFEEYGLDTSSAARFNEEYQLRLGDVIVYCDDSKSIVERFREKNVEQYAVTNGTIVAQTKKLKRSGLGELMDAVFMSEEVGAEKPSPEFFDRVFERLGGINKEEILIVGDSLTSDMKGGILAGIKTCWYNPKKTGNHLNLPIDWEITDLHELFEIVGSDING